MMYELDQSIGRLVKALLDKNMLQNTIIVFSTDNGGVPAPLNQNAGSNWPLKGVCIIWSIRNLNWFLKVLLPKFTGQKLHLGRWSQRSRPCLVTFTSEKQAWFNL